MNIKNIFSFKLASLGLVSLSLVACGTQTHLRQETANRIAVPAFMIERNIPTGNFDLNVWERMHRRGQPMTVYVEGDSTSNPTPANPVALHLASRDLAKNVAYIARPCQFIKFPEKKGCSSC